jgi:hypothetical protein
MLPKKKVKDENYRVISKKIFQPRASENLDQAQVFVLSSLEMFQALPKVILKAL